MSERQHQIFEAALNKIRCPKCKGRVLETMMPDAICEKCGTQYVLATRLGKGFFGGGLHAQLIEKNQPAPPAIPFAQPQVITSTQTVGKFCHNCGSQVSNSAQFCTKCGTRLS